MRFWNRHLSLRLSGTILFLNLMTCAKVQNQDLSVFGFTKAVHPISFDPLTQSAHNMTTGEIYADSESCRSCHETIYENWYGSRHRVALTNPIYQESHARETSVWCVNCHAPFMRPGGNPEILSDRVQAADGISCITCHVREGKILTGREPQYSTEKAVHQYLIVPAMKNETFCESCHQFNFTTASSTESMIQYSEQVMQGTVSEWRHSSFAGKVGCGECHLFRGTKDSHSFPGGHSLKQLSEALRVEIKRLDGTHIEVQVISLGIGHAFPTGDLFRTLRLQVEGSGVSREIVLKKVYGGIPVQEIKPQGPMKILLEDTVIPPPYIDYASSRATVIGWPESSNQVKYQLFIDYLHEVNHLTTKLTQEQTAPLVKEGTIEIGPSEKANRQDPSG